MAPSTVQRVEVPHDIQRLIFEKAALDDRRVAWRLLTLCRHVQPWIESLFYETVFLGSATRGTAFTRASHTKPDSFFAAKVHALCTTIVRKPDALRALALCTGVSSLALWSPKLAEADVRGQLVEAAQRLRPQRLSTTLALYAHLAPGAQGLFGNVTHFELVIPFFPSTVASSDEFPSLAVVLDNTRLTHLCLSWMFPSTGLDLGPLFATILASSADLQVILVNFSTVELWLYPLRGVPLRAEWVDGSLDRRIVVGSDNPLQASHPLAKCCISRKPAHLTDDWAWRLPEGDVGMWELAEEKIASRVI